MTRMNTVWGVAGMLFLSLAVYMAGAQDLKDISLPPPRMEGGKPLMQALKERQTTRAFSTKKLPLQVLSDLLWAAAGINRPDSGKRTAPSAMNWQEIQVYAIMEDGAYLYDAKANILKMVAKGDLRKLTGSQDFVASAPLNLLFIADTTKIRRVTGDDLLLFMGADTGYISQNVYLFCASEGLVTVVRGMVNRKALSKEMNLPDTMRIVLAQTVGYPK